MSVASTPAAGLKTPRVTKNGANWSAVVCDALVQCFDLSVARWVVDTGYTFSGEFHLADNSLVKYEAKPGYIWGHVLVDVVIGSKVYGYTVSHTKPYKPQCEATAVINVVPLFGDASLSDRRLTSATLWYVSNSFRREWRNASPA